MKTTHSNPFFRVARLVAVLLLVVTGGWRMNAQTPTQQNAPTQRVGTITVKFVGAANVNEQVVRANMQVREGGPLDETMIDGDIRSLYRTGLFEFIEVKRDRGNDQSVNLVYEVTPKFRVLAVRYEGNVRVKSRRLEKEAKTRANMALDERQVKEDAEKIREYYQKAGYNQVSITYAIERDRSTGFGTVIFKIKEGNKVKIDSIRFVGNDNVKPRRLRKEMETKRHWMFSWLTGSGRFKDDQFEDDLEKVRDYYREQGFLDVAIDFDKIQFDYPNPKELVITIRVEEGKRYRVGDITFNGNKLYQTGLLRLILQQKSGMIFTPSKLDKDVTAIEDFYGRDGYLDTRVRLNRKPNIATGNIDVEYQIQESEKFFVESVKIEGNTKTKSIVILRELVLGPGEVFDMVRMKISKQRLENTRFFEDVNTTPETSNIPSRRNLKVAVKEGRTGNLTFGAGFSSLERAVIFAELTQSNFDLFNRRSFFQGDGQKFRLRMQLGSYSSEVVMSFEEPWLFERELALGFSVFRTSSDYESAYYEEIRTGGEVYLRKRLFELVEAKLAYTAQEIEIRDVDESIQLFYPEGKSFLSTVGLQLLRDTRDKIINTTSGNRAELNLDLSTDAIGSDFNYYKAEFRGSQFFPVFDTQSQVLAVIGRLGVLDTFGNNDKGKPRFEYFTLGGPYTLRGFEYRDVGPKNSAGEPIGGQSYGFLSIEYTIDIVSPIRFAIFYDAGFINDDPYDFNPGSYNDNFGFGLGLFVAGAPLRLDFGIPITGDRFNKKGNQFNFSFGTRF
ncbi:MAG TPA: outer membrane protein assembly factor BamA [Opitutaceae bacterium]|nr:outer membrane protein assembly factor BamA [Opitutaceae bacterium]